MLTNTFCHIPGIGEKTERALWDAGVTSWHFALPRNGLGLARLLHDSWSQHMQESLDHHAGGKPSYFADKLLPKHRWRLYHDFRDRCAFLDIETTGLSAYDKITTAVLYDGRSVRYFVNGENLEEFPGAISQYPLLVTYNGNGFDIRFIKRFFRIQLDQAHIDLRYPLQSLGFKGGLKGCERQLGTDRSGLEGVDGRFASLLWSDFRARKNRKALETLVAYNIQDTVVLHRLMVHTHNEKIAATPFADSYALPMPVPPPLPFQPDQDTVQRLLRQIAMLRAISQARFQPPAKDS